MIPFQAVAEDLEWLQDEWWLGFPDHLTNGHLRRGSSAIGALTIDGLLVRAWRHYGFEGEPTIVGPDLAGLAVREGVQLEMAATVIAGGGRERLLEMAMIGAFRVANPETGAPANADVGFAVKQTGLQRPANILIANSDPLINRVWTLSEYLSAPGVVRRGTLIPREILVDYFRRHANSNRELPQPSVAGSAAATSQTRAELFAMLDETAGKSHADGRDGLYFELLSIGQALGGSRDLQALTQRIREQQRAERRSSPPRAAHETKVTPGVIRTLRLPDSPPDPDAVMLENAIRIWDLDTPIYRIFPLLRFRELMESGRMALVPPSWWEDPFEDLVSKCVVVPANGDSQISLSTLRAPTYGQCWTLTEESDGLWRNYSVVEKDSATGRNLQPKREGVKVRTTIRRLLRALWRSAPEKPDDTCYLGAVRYMPARYALESVAAEIASARDRAFSGGRGHAESLLVKRGPFSYEREVRLLYVDLPKAMPVGVPFLVQVDPNDLFSQVTIDPRLSAQDRIDRETEFRRLGFVREIGVSDLYENTIFAIRM
jgi:hypothetical protein